MMTTTLQNDNTHETVKRLLGLIKKDVDQSHTLYSLGASTEFSQRIQDMVTNPLEAMLNTYNSSHDNMKGLLDVIFRAFLDAKKNLFEKVYHVDAGSSLIYYISFKEDSTENRELIFDFIDEFESTMGISDKIEIVVEFIPKRVLHKINLKDEIVFN